MDKQFFSKKLVVLLALIVPAQMAFAAAGPDARLSTWLGSFEQFLEQHQDLSQKEAVAIWEAIDIATPALFRDHLTAQESGLIAERLSGIRETLSCDDYNDIRTNLLKMEDWMQANNVALVVGDCYCTKVAAEETASGETVVAGDGCAEGWVCDNTIKCISREGTTHNGRCRRQ